ncbi:MAG: Uncharacterised protein [Acidimicrobiales bacterium AG-410-I20]|nr:MAG: Uncharacterised protein [Acidimicrobiales bacterium AG-410-I20]
MFNETFLSPIPLDAIESEDGCLRIRDCAHYTKILLRKRIGAEDTPETEVLYGKSKLRTDGTLITGSRPDEWTLYNPTSDATDLIQEYAAIKDQVILVDITHGRSLLSLEGENAGKVLEKICNIDFSDEMVPDGACLSASIGNVSCDLVRTGTNKEISFLIACERSFGNYLFRVLVDAGREFEMTPPIGLELH